MNHCLRRQCLILVVFLLLSLGAAAQLLSNRLCGVYTCGGCTYESFVFHGNGKLEISASLMAVQRDYFQCNDTLIVYPDISVFKFIVQRDGSLKGISEWVKDSVWYRLPADTVECKAVPATPTNEKRLTAMYIYERARLLVAKKDRTEGDFELALDDFAKSCDSGYGPACNLQGSYSQFLKGEAKAMAAWGRGCAIGDGDCCNQLGDVYKRKKAINKAAAYYKKACEFGNIAGCTWNLENQLPTRQPKAASKTKQLKK